MIFGDLNSFIISFHIFSYLSFNNENGNVFTQAKYSQLFVGHLNSSSCYAHERIQADWFNIYHPEDKWCFRHGISILVLWIGM